MMSLVDLGKRLLEAAKNGDTVSVKSLMSNGAPFTTDWLGTSPLHFAALNGHTDTAYVLLRAGISRDARTKVDRTPLHAASQEGHLELVDLLLKSGADIEAKDMLKMTPLHWAVEKAQMAVIDLLLKHGADVLCETKFDQSSIDIALRNGRADIAQVLQQSQSKGRVDDEPGLNDPPLQVVEEQVVEDEVAAESIIGQQIAAADGMTSDDVSGAQMISELPLSPVIVSGDMLTSTQSLQMADEGADAAEGEEKQSTEVLNTLAALAEASGPLNTTVMSGTNSSDTLTWLEAQGLTLINANDTGLLNAGMDGQTLTLTEAGKLVLSKYKSDDGDEANLVQPVVLEDGGENILLVNSTDAGMVNDKVEIIPKRKKFKVVQSGGTIVEVVANTGVEREVLRRKISASLKPKH